MLGYNDLLSRPSIELNTIWEPIIKKKAVFTSYFFLIANVFHGTLRLVLCLVGIHSTAASKRALMKFSYSSFRVCVSVFSCCALNLFLSFKAYLSLISLLLSREQL